MADTKYQIEKDVPIPETSRGPGSMMYPFRYMEIGDSVFIPGKTRTTINGSLAHAKNLTGFKFTVRTVAGGIRVWRVS